MKLQRMRFKISMAWRSMANGLLTICLLLSLPIAVPSQLIDSQYTLSTKQIEDILDAHNYARADVAVTASNMKEMVS